MTDLYDVVVVGAGPAGSAAALRALQVRPDARVLLLDRADFPRDKTCGDGIAPHGLDVLARLGVPDAVAGYPPVPGLRLRAPTGQVMAGRMARAGHVVPRAVLDARLVAAAVARGAELRRHRARRVEVRPDVVVVDGEVAGRAVVAADGANGVVRRQLGLPSQPEGALAVACRGYAALPPGQPHAGAPGAPGGGAAGAPLEQLVAMTRRGWPAYAWCFPIGDGRANVGFGKVVRRLGEEGRGGRAELFDRLAEELPDLTVDPATLRAARLPLSRWRPRQPDGRVALAGDALSLVNPLTGEGIFYALASGRLAGEAAALQPEQAGGVTRAALARELGRHLRHTTALARLADSPGLVGVAVGAAGRHRSVFDAAVEIGLGRGTVGARTGALVAASALRATAGSRRPRR